MMRTPFFILASASAERMLFVFSVIGTCSVMKSARLSRSSSSTFSTPSARALRRQIGVEGDDAHLQADAALGDDGADIAAADQPQRLGR
jgi:hypothetical protein